MGIKSKKSLPLGRKYRIDFGNSSSGKSSGNNKLEVISKPLLSPLIQPEIPTELKSKYYTLQSIVGGIGILLVFASFTKPILLVPATLSIFLKNAWRKKTDPLIVNYKNMRKFYKTQKYTQCIEFIHKILLINSSYDDLNLVKAECYLKLNQSCEAYKTYKEFFVRNHPSSLTDAKYLLSKENALTTAMDHEDYTLAFEIAQSLPDNIVEETNYKTWKNYYMGVCLLNMEEFKKTVDLLKLVIKKTRPGENLFLDSHYHLGMAYLKLNKINQAKQSFQIVYDLNPDYKDTASIFNTIQSSGSCSEI